MLYSVVIYVLTGQPREEGRNPQEGGENYKGDFCWYFLSRFPVDLDNPAYNREKEQSHKTIAKVFMISVLNTSHRSSSLAIIGRNK